MIAMKIILGQICPLLSTVVGRCWRLLIGESLGSSENRYNNFINLNVGRDGAGLIASKTRITAWTNLNFHFTPLSMHDFPRSAQIYCVMSAPRRRKINQAVREAAKAGSRASLQPPGHVKPKKCQFPINFHFKLIIFHRRGNGCRLQIFIPHLFDHHKSNFRGCRSPLLLLIEIIKLFTN